MTTSIADILTTVRDRDVRLLFAIAAQTVDARTRFAEERARTQAAQRAAAHEVIHAACITQLPPNLRPYVRRLITDEVTLPVRPGDVAVLELRFDDLELELRVRCRFEPTSRRGPGAWVLQDYQLPSVYTELSRDHARPAYDFLGPPVLAYDEQDALYHLMLLVAEFRMAQKECAGR